MPVTFHIPGALREFTAGQSRVTIEHSPATLADALSALWALYPGVRDRITTEQGQVREHINIFIGDENVRYTGGLASPVSTGSEISIVPAVSGGRENSGDEESVGAGPFRRGTWSHRPDWHRPSQTYCRPRSRIRSPLRRLITPPEGYSSPTTCRLRNSRSSQVQMVDGDQDGCRPRQQT